MPCKVTQDGQVIMKSSDKMWFTRKGNDNPLLYSCLENPMESMRRQNNLTLYLKQLDKEKKKNLEYSRRKKKIRAEINEKKGRYRKEK